MSDASNKLPCHIRPEEQARVRRCGDCGADMKSEDCRLLSSPWLFHDRLIRFHCEDCGSEAEILDGETVGVRLFILVAIFGLAIAMVMYGGFAEIYDLLTDFSWLSLLGLVYAGLTIITIMVGITTAAELAHDLKARRHHPRVQGCSGRNRFLKTLFLGLIPWLIASAIGMYDFYVRDLSENLAILLLPIVFAPVFSAHKLGLSVSGTFLATLLWMPVLYFLFETFS